MAAERWGRGWQLIVSTLKILQRYPVFMVPILIVWAIYAPIILYLKYFFPWGNYGLVGTLWVVFLMLFIFSFIILLSCSVMLELIQQLENGKKLNLSGAFQETLGKNIIKIIPIAVIWAIIWFILTVIQALFSRKEKEGREGFNAENAARTLAGYQNFSLSDAFFAALKKGVRMIVFLILPAVAWEDLGFTLAIKKGLRVLTAHLGEFASGYALTYVAAAIVFLPPAIIFELGDSKHGAPLVHFPDTVWAGTIIYIAFAWSFCMYLEQMFTANLYLWHLKWEKMIDLAKQQNQALPDFKDIKQPSLLDNVPDLLA